ncbi:hypothetical protein D1872_298270 [compost metagenome]
MVGRLIEQENVRSVEHHFSEHATHLFSPGQYTCFLKRLFSGEQHTSQKSAKEGLILIVRILTQPIYQINLNAIKVCRVIFREICLGSSYTPAVFALISFQLTHNNLEQRCFRK